MQHVRLFRVFVCFVSAFILPPTTFGEDRQKVLEIGNVWSKPFLLPIFSAISGLANDMPQPLLLVLFGTSYFPALLISSPCPEPPDPPAGANLLPPSLVPPPPSSPDSPSRAFYACAEGNFFEEDRELPQFILFCGGGGGGDYWGAKEDGVVRRAWEWKKCAGPKGEDNYFDELKLIDPWFCKQKIYIQQQLLVKIYAQQTAKETATTDQKSSSNGNNNRKMLKSNKHTNIATRQQKIKNPICRPRVSAASAAAAWIDLRLGRRPRLPLRPGGLLLLPKRKEVRGRRRISQRLPEQIVRLGPAVEATGRGITIRI